MTTLTSIQSDRTFQAPPLSLPRLIRRLLAQLMALDVLFRERGQLAELDDRILRDIGVSRADVADALRRPDAHLRLVVLRSRNQFEH